MKNKIDMKSWKRGFFAGLFKSKNVKKSKNKQSKNELLELSERYRTRGLGALQYKGKIYDTNFKGKPTLLTKDFLRKIRPDYGPELSDLEVADRYVKHMRRKYGTFDKDGRFLGLLGKNK